MQVGKTSINLNNVETNQVKQNNSSDTLKSSSNKEIKININDTKITSDDLNKGKVPTIAKGISFSDNEATNEPPVKKEKNVTEKKGTLSIGWGYGRQIYGPSDVHIKGEGHDFTMRGVRAYDRPASFSFDTYFNPSKLSIPQYMADFTYFPTNNLYIELNPNHHMKWVADPDQMVQVTGYIDPSLSEKYGGTHENTYIPMKDIFKMLEHTNGYNYVNAGAGVIYPLAESKNGKHAISLKAGVHAGGIVTKTEAYLFDKGADHPFKLCGFGYGTKVGLRVDLFKHFFIEGNTEFMRGHLDGFNTTGKKGDKGSQTINTMNNYFTVGVNIPLNKK
ncbi:MAG: hypothetical protein KatS3mg068_0397 [Candidatus Sericytochromatia bacterium]|nr:MAG: hypothetical protein KatS3mg068_0397 [Candidatus Sericytochromatia bacterium]